MSVDHYENFPVASLLLPAQLRPAVAAIYAFARTADDFADEGRLPAGERLRLLASYRGELERIERSQPTGHPVFLRLRPHIEAHRLPLQAFRDLLDAFAQDVVKDRYASFDELIDYCRRSANPVGRLLLHLFGEATPDNLRRSDAICSALQLINHWQDVGIDLDKGENGRIYLPQDELRRFAMTEDQLKCRTASAEFRALMRFQPLLNFEWVTVHEDGSPRPGVKGGLRGYRSPAQRTLDAWNRAIRWPVAGCSGVVHPATETCAAIAESSARVKCAPL